PNFQISISSASYAHLMLHSAGECGKRWGDRGAIVAPAIQRMVGSRNSPTIGWAQARHGFSMAGFFDGSAGLALGEGRSMFPYHRHQPWSDRRPLLFLQCPRPFAMRPIIQVLRDGSVTMSC